jgi:hypothetical protein
VDVQGIFFLSLTTCILHNNNKELIHMANQVIIATSSIPKVEITAETSDAVGEGGPGNPDWANAVPIQFRIEITPDGILGPLTASDSRGRKYGVCITLTNPDGDQCCCPDGQGGTYCSPFKLGGCHCDPK